MEEADVILVNKIDLLNDSAAKATTGLLAKEYPRALVTTLSALTGEGADDWLSLAMRKKASGDTLAEVDYDIYAEGEAVLGWLNASVGLTAKSGTTDWESFFLRLITALGEGFRSRDQDIGHLKLLLSAGEECLAGNLIRTGGQLFLRGAISPQTRRADLLINARVETDPAGLEELVLTELRALYALYGLEPEARALKCISPGRPEPTWRYDHVVRPAC